MTAPRPTRIVLHGFKSIRESDLRLQNLNVVIGANGGGKSNFFDFFRLMRHLANGQLQEFVRQQGGPDALLHHGRQVTPQMRAEVHFGERVYGFALRAEGERMVFAEEALWDAGARMVAEDTTPLSGHPETRLQDDGDQQGLYRQVMAPMQRWQVFRFHDMDAARQPQDIAGGDRLRPDGSNLAAHLHSLKERGGHHYFRVLSAARMTAPFLKEILLRPQPGDPTKIELQWREREGGRVCGAHQLSDATLRLLCLWALLDGDIHTLPEPIMLDESESGLNDYPMAVLGATLSSVATGHQVIASTQCPELLDELEPEDIVVADRNDATTRLHRLDINLVNSWLEDSSLSELWMKNWLGGRHAR